MLQTLATAGSRRALLGSLGAQGARRILDAGCGYGCSAVELAALAGVEVLGVDTDEEKLAVARQVGGGLAKAGALHPGASVSFERGDVRALEVPARSFDGAVVRFVLEYLERPAEAASELARVLVPGGFCCAIDVDDGLSITYPDGASESLAVLTAAFVRTQAARGIDRHIGRKLPAILDAAGFDVGAVVVLPQARYGRSAPGDLDRRFLVERFSKLKGELVEVGGITEEAFERALAEMAAQTMPKVCEIEGHVAVIARRRRE